MNFDPGEQLVQGVPSALNTAFPLREEKPASLGSGYLFSDTAVQSEVGTEIFPWDF